MTTTQSDATVAGYGPRQFAYSANHPLSPLALPWDLAGPVLVTDNLRADIAHAIDRKMLQRGYGLGLISTDHGQPADMHQSITGLWLDECSHPADYLVRWIETGCQWARGEKASAIDSRAEVAHELDRIERYELEQSADAGDELEEWTRALMSGADVPAWWIDWASNLVYAPKFEYLVRLGAHAWLGAHEPRDPGTAWADKMRKQWARRSHKCERQS